MAWDYYKVRKIAWADREANTDLLIMSLSQLVDSNQYVMVVLSRHCVVTVSGGRSYRSVEPKTH
jgi:hypothetical protein